MEGRMGIAAVCLAVASGCPEGRAVVVDRVESGRAVLLTERGAQLEVAESQLPRGAGEGDVLVDGRVDEARRARQVREVEDRRARLSAQDDGKDILLDVSGP